jgi:hypothetical protein
MIGFCVFVIILIVIVNAKEARETGNREFKTLIDGSTVCIGYDFYAYEHQLRMEDPNDPEVKLMAIDPKRDGKLRFTVINRENVPDGHFLQRYANWEDAEAIYNKAVAQRDVAQNESGQ